MSTLLQFPGQGSQTVGMGKSLFENHPEAQAVFEQADEALGFSISEICFNGPEEKLKLTEFTQPAILTHSVATLRVLLSKKEIKPHAVAGHSLGEYSALVAAGSLNFADAVKIVNLRGKAMQEAVPEGVGAMAAILRATSDEVTEICKKAQATLSDQEMVRPANYNAPEQTVIAGTKAGVEKAIELMKEDEHLKRARATLLPVSAPFHCPLMKSATDKMTAVIHETQFKPNELPYIANITGELVSAGTSEDTIRENLIRQIENPVQWVNTMKVILDSGATDVIEVGPGNVLTNLLKRFAKTEQQEINALNIPDTEALKEFFNS